MAAFWKSVCAGMIAGAAASFAMNQYQSVVSAAVKAVSGHPAFNQDQDATIKTAEAVSQIVFQRELTEPEKKWAVPAVHYSMGMGFGALYGVLADRLPPVRAAWGLAYGTGVWIFADEIAVPMLGFAKGPAETSLSAHANALGSHLVYGLVTEAARKLLLRA